ncbi:coproporphyrinogen III oxidase [Caulobacter sp. D4A]|uniref:radical SAM family heme chaperone HemW n=1 Tax=unclassified Caulobacter TaxID=2648921 RepID=UPI000D73149D|nr:MULTISPECIES: radical SAM family heme chaperone HemW [unclassified Caulobacter]PXA84901.1 coproporphyrinogen III oxidase [Caulobacter sp. D4A]PXA88459.1 coproporphyrinogen III oxidase [Caulobacter sp. D5]
MGLPPLGLYVHWPYCARICPYCDFNVVRDRGRTDEQAALADAIVADMTAQRALTGPRRLLSIFFGGGTPSLMDPAAVARVIATAKTLWSPADDLEISLEANPTDAEAGRFEALAQAGVARLSLGVQALDDASLKMLGRNHDAGSARRAVATAARLFPRLSVDLIYARPGQTDAAWREELGEMLAYGPEHVSPYQLTIEAGTAFDRAVGRGRIVPPDEDLAAQLFETTQEVLEAAGFDAYEVSNHARGPAARSRHNLVYWRGVDYVGVGPGAHGRLTLPSGKLATTARAKITDYIAAVARDGTGFEREDLTPVEAAEERLLLGLRIDDGVAFAEMAALDLSADTPKVKSLVESGLLVDDPYRLRATRQGRLVLDRLTGMLAT